MTPAELAQFHCKYCGKTFSDGRRLGGHVRQLHPVVKPGSTTHATAPLAEGETAARILELWKAGDDPLTVVATLRVHPRFVKEVLKEYDELINEWKKFKEA
ncbi:MAG TPA: C2H2-type zinc finger protein [Nitrososphaerales archaeon]|nr:C2H2-type zinc finger protein [Nitrososphaerales archaeon]